MRRGRQRDRGSDRAENMDGYIECMRQIDRPHEETEKVRRGAEKDQQGHGQMNGHIEGQKHAWVDRRTEGAHK